MDINQTVEIEKVRQFWNRKPCNVGHSPAPVGTEQFFVDVSTRKYFVEPHIPSFARFEDWAGKSVLEIGCGIGTDTERFARAGAKVVAVDLSSESLRLADQRLRIFGLRDSVELIEANAEELSLHVPSRPFDLVYSFGVLHHTPQPERAIAQLPNFMGNESLLRIMVYNRLSTKTFALMMRHGWPRPWHIDEAVAKQSEAQYGSPYTYTYTRNSICRMLERNGIESTRVSTDHIFPYSIKPYKEFRYRRRWYWGIVPRPVFSQVERRLGWHLLVEGRLATQ